MDANKLLQVCSNPTRPGLFIENSFRYLFLEKHLPVVSIKYVSIKVGLDQFLLAPFLINMYFFFNEILQGKGYEGYAKRFENEYWNTVTSCWMLWVPVQVIQNFNLFHRVNFTVRLSYFSAGEILHHGRTPSRI